MAEFLTSAGFFTLIGFAIFWKHQRKLLELQILSGKSINNNSHTNSELQEVLAQLHELRDTTTRYDMSFDSALQRLEGRVNRIEQMQHQSSSISAGINVGGE